MADDSDLADDLIPGSLKKSPSYHRDYGKKTYGEIKALAGARPPDPRARQMKKLIEERDRLQGKAKKHRR